MWKPEPVNKNDSQYNGQKKKDKPTNYDLQNSTQEAKEKGQADKLWSMKQYTGSKRINKNPTKNRGWTHVAEALTVSAPLVAPIVLLINDSNIMWYGIVLNTSKHK